jgi:hypothetical protein
VFAATKALGLQSRRRTSIVDYRKRERDALGKEAALEK